MNIVKIGGLLASFASDTVGIPFSDKLSMVLEEITKSSAEIKEGLKRIEQIVTGQIIGLAESAKFHLEDATSSFLTDEEKLAEVRKAKDLLQECYGALLQTPVLNKHRGEVAFAIAGCNAILGINDRRDYWLKASLKDFLAFGEATIEIAPTAQKGLLQGAVFLLGSPVMPVVTVVMAVTGAWLPALGFASAFGTALKSGGELQKIEAVETLLKEQQAEALQGAKEVELVIAQLPKAE
jgi:hypothetical protein